MDNVDIGILFSLHGERELENVINLYGEKLLRYATAILCDYQSAEDVVQEVFISAYQHHKSFDGKNISAWLYKITYNRCINTIKKRKILYFDKLPEIIDIQNDEKEFSDNVIFALKKLKPKDRALVYGRIIEGQSYGELSILLGKSQTSLRKQYERAKKKLATYLSDI